jgi:hypothetical protein
MLGGNDLTITYDGETKGYVLPVGREFGESSVHVTSIPSVNVASGSTTPAQPGGQYDVRDADGAKAITHLDWSLGAGQTSLDALDASPYRYEDSNCMNITTKGQMKLQHTSVASETPGISGPMFSALGYIWWTSLDGQVYYTDYMTPTGWSSYTATWPATKPLSPVTSFATDGQFIYAAIPGGSTPGVYKGTMTGTACAFARMSTEPATTVCCAGGEIYIAKSFVSGSVDSVAGILDSASSYALSTSDKTPANMENYTSVALSAVGSDVYWTVSQGSTSLVYQLHYDTEKLTTEQFLEFPTGFVATCSHGYLGTLYLGGYWETSIANTGKGAVYVGSDGYAAPLFSIGEQPEDTDVPEVTENDNRIFSLAAFSKELYFLTNRGVYKWDIDDGGYSHVMNLGGGGASLDAWNATYTWDCAADPASGWTPTYGGDADLSYATAGTARVVETTGYVDLTANPTLSASDGFTLDLTTPGGHWYVYMNNGSYQAFAVVGGVSTVGDSTLYTYDGSNWAATHVISHSLPAVVRLTLRSNYATMMVDGDADTMVSTFSTKASAAADEILLRGFNAAALSDIKLNTTEALYSAYSTEPYDCGSVAIIDGQAVVDYSIPSYAASEVITSASLANPTVITTVGHHPFVSGNSVYISGVLGAVTSPAGGLNNVAHTVTKTGDHTFTVPINVTTAGTQGVACLAAKKSEGFMYTNTDRYPTAGYLTQSGTTFHTGSMKKDFRSVEVLHETLPTGAALDCTAWIDGVPYDLTGTTAGNKTVFPIDVRGYSVKTRLTMERSDGATVIYETPVVTAINVIFEFLKGRRHLYILDCRAGAKGGRWREDPATAINFLFSGADKAVTVEDAFSGSYSGFIEEVQLSAAASSVKENVSGIVKLSVREPA